MSSDHGSRDEVDNIRIARVTASTDGVVEVSKRSIGAGVVKPVGNGVNE